MLILSFVINKNMIIKTGKFILSKKKKKRGKFMACLVGEFFFFFLFLKL